MLNESETKLDPSFTLLWYWVYVRLHHITSQRKEVRLNKGGAGNKNTNVPRKEGVKSFFWGQSTLAILGLCPLPMRRGREPRLKASSAHPAFFGCPTPLLHIPWGKNGKQSVCREGSEPGALRPAGVFHQAQEKPLIRRPLLVLPLPFPTLFLPQGMLLPFLSTLLIFSIKRFPT